MIITYQQVRLPRPCWVYRPVAERDLQNQTEIDICHEISKHNENMRRNIDTFLPYMQLANLDELLYILLIN